MVPTRMIFFFFNRLACWSLWCSFVVSLIISNNLCLVIVADANIPFLQKYWQMSFPIFWELLFIPHFFKQIVHILLTVVSLSVFNASDGIASEPTVLFGSEFRSGICSLLSCWRFTANKQRDLFLKAICLVVCFFFSWGDLFNGGMVFPGMVCSTSVQNVPLTVFFGLHCQRWGCHWHASLVQMADSLAFTC